MQVRWYPIRFTYVNLKGFTCVSKKIHLHLLNDPPCSLNNSIRLIVVLISHTGTLSLAPHLLYVFIVYVFRIADFYKWGMSDLTCGTCGMWTVHSLSAVR